MNETWKHATWKKSDTKNVKYHMTPLKIQTRSLHMEKQTGWYHKLKKEANGE
jgi:hypothetical protein